MRKNARKYLLTKDKVKIYYETYKINKKNALVFLHGLGGDLTAWKKERQYFHNLGVSTIAVDLRGHGFSDKSDNKEFYALSNFANDILSIMNYEKFESYTTIGHCFGGMISMILESNHKKTSKNLVLIDTSYRPPIFVSSLKNNLLISSIVELIINILPKGHKSKHINFELFKDTGDINLKRLLSDVLHMSLKSYLLICQKLVDYDARKLLKNIVVPTLVVEGLKDSIFPSEIAIALKKRIKHSQLDFIPNANHILVLNNPEDLEADIEIFLRKNAFL